MWMNTVNVSDWHRMYPQMILTKLMSTTILSSDTWNSYYAFTCGLTNSLGVYVVIVALISYVVNKVPSARILMQRRILLPFSATPLFTYLIDTVSITIGECMFWFLWLSVMVSTGYYWMHIHIFDEDDSKVPLELWARYTGILAIMFMTASLFCTSRIRLWNDVF